MGGEAGTARGGCLAALASAAMIGVALVATIYFSAKCSADPKADKPAPSVADVPSSVPSSSSIPTSDVARQRSPFDTLWETATARDHENNLNAAFSLKLSQADYCDTYKCGDEFGKEQGWKAARDEAGVIKAGTWRAETDEFDIGEFDPAHLRLPVQVTWPRRLSGTPAAPRRPAIERLVAPNGEAANLWKEFSETLFTLKFETSDAARECKTGKHDKRKIRFVFRVTDVALDSVKQTSAGVTLDSGAGALLIVRIVGAQLREGDATLSEKIDVKK